MGNVYYELIYKNCIYSGISNKINFETRNGTEDKTEELEYIVAKYNEEVLMSGDSLYEQLEGYKKALAERDLID